MSLLMIPAIYVFFWWLTSVLMLRKFGAEGQRELDTLPDTKRVLRCTGKCEKSKYNYIGEHSKECWDRIPREKVYVRQDGDVLVALAWGLVWPVTGFIMSVALASPKSRSEKDAALRARNIELEQQLAEAEKRYAALTK